MVLGMTETMREGREIGKCGLTMPYIRELLFTTTRFTLDYIRELTPLGGMVTA
jgi:hypothetical protein